MSGLAASSSGSLGRSAACTGGSCLSHQRHGSGHLNGDADDFPCEVPTISHLCSYSNSVLLASIENTCHIKVEKSVKVPQPSVYAQRNQASSLASGPIEQP